MQLPPEEYYKNLPKKYMGAGVLFFNDEGKVLIVKPQYKEGKWEIPGGVVDQDESPKAAAIREVKEEIGLTISNPRLICVHYRPVRGIKPDSVQFVFNGGTLSKEQISNIKLEAEEIAEYGFFREAEAVECLVDGVSERLLPCLDAIKNNTVAYLES
jgi:8-oxo-dGTP pyrophosphatase MutT (NUDIX family)